MAKKQPNLFNTRPEPWEFDDAEAQCVVTVVIREGVDFPLDYSVPDELRESLEPGMRVRVPLGRGNRVVTGYCVALSAEQSRRALKPVKAVLDKRPLLSKNMIELTRWMSTEYICAWGKVLEGVVPAGVRTQAGTREVTLLHVPTNVAARATKLKLPPQQSAVIRYLLSCPGPRTIPQILDAVSCSAGPVQALRKKGLVISEQKRVLTADQAQELPQEKQQRPNLNEDQSSSLHAILSALNDGRHETHVVHGVTGSGKTEVYIRAIEEVMRFGRQAIVLVPEISLTPQTCRRFRSRFENVAVLHSHLSDSQRNWYWQQISSGSVPVIVGARSAIFAPTPHLGLIVVDEEHDSSFKQDSVPRYHACDVALFRAKTENIPLVLGSATPSLETWHKANNGTFSLLSMPNRVLNRRLPDVTLIDLRDEFRKKTYQGAISRPLQRDISETLRKKGQIILLLNRRGFSTHIQCPACGEVVRCPDCDIALTHHRHDESALCHYCDHRIPAPTICPNCRFEGIRYGGLGTQKLEAEVRSKFRGATCLRMDSDSMRQHGSHEQALAQFREGQIDILVGTQMIAKGLDFPNVTLVGVVNADTALHLPDFRAAERTFQLVTQVAGRTGRGSKGGHVVVQTTNPDHPAIQAAARHDYQSFVNQELPIRKQFQYPPFGHMIRLVVRGPSETQTVQFCQSMVEKIAQGSRNKNIPIRVLGPAEAPIAKLRGLWRFHALLQAEDQDALRQVVQETVTDQKNPPEVQWILDVDPLDML